MKLAEPISKYDSELVYEFYANAWTEKQSCEECKSRVRGHWIFYHPKAIDEFLGNPFPDQEVFCAYQRLKSTPNGFDINKVAYTLYFLDRSYQKGPGGLPKRIRRKDMRTIIQVWLTFMLANIAPSGHVSQLNIPRCNLLFSLVQEDVIVNVSRIIFDEIQKFVDVEVNQFKGRRRGALGFPGLITTLCRTQGVPTEAKATFAFQSTKTTLIRTASIQ